MLIVDIGGAFRRTIYLLIEIVTGWSGIPTQRHTLTLFKLTI